MRDDAGVETVCSYQNVQLLLDAEHRLREALALAREQLMNCQHALEQLSESRKCSRLQHLPLHSVSVCHDSTSHVRYSECHDNLGGASPIMATSDGLTPRESEVLHLIAAGMSNRVIADTLFLSPRTIERHIANIYLKIDVHSKAEATAFALHHDFARLE